MNEQPPSSASRLPWVLTFLLTVAIAAFVALVATGKVEVRAVPRPTAANGGPQILPVAVADEMFAALGQRAYCWKYEGGWIDCWIEVEVEGKTTRLGEELGDELRGSAAASGAGNLPAPSGHLIWVRREEKGKELWDLALTVTGADAQRLASVRRVGMSPPPGATAGTRDGPTSGGSLAGVRDLTLAQYTTFDEKITRTAVLKCKPAK